VSHEDYEGAGVAVELTPEQRSVLGRAYDLLAQAQARRFTTELAWEWRVSGDIRAALLVRHSRAVRHDRGGEYLLGIEVAADDDLPPNSMLLEEKLRR
jgi:hypothetical protein